MKFPTLSYTDADGQHDVLLDRQTTTIGRLPDQDVVLRDQSVSRQHATIVRENNSYSIVDRNSSHGTFLNGIRVQRAPLNPGDVLQLGSLEGPELQFHFPVVSLGEPTSQAGMVSSLRFSVNDFPLIDEKQPAAAREMPLLERSMGWYTV